MTRVERSLSVCVPPHSAGGEKERFPRQRDDRSSVHTCERAVCVFRGVCRFSRFESLVFVSSPRFVEIFPYANAGTKFGPDLSLRFVNNLLSRNAHVKYARVVPGI